MHIKKALADATLPSPLLVGSTNPNQVPRLLLVPGVLISAASSPRPPSKALQKSQTSKELGSLRQAQDRLKEACGSCTLIACEAPRRLEEML